MTINNLGTPYSPDAYVDDYAAYLGRFRSSYIGYANATANRERVASGGVVTTIARFVLEQKIVDGVAMGRADFSSGFLGHEFKIVRNADDIKRFGTSAYFNIPIEKYLKQMREFQGRLAVCCLPCHARIIRKCQNTKNELRNLKLLVSLFCGHNNQVELFKFVFKKAGISENQVSDMWVERSHLGGCIRFRMNDGAVKVLPFRHFNIYRSLGIFSKKMCKYCDDHVGAKSDISVGDIFLGEFRSHIIKHSSILIRTEVGEEIFQSAIKKKYLSCWSIDQKKIFQSQRRILIPSGDFRSRYYACKMFGYPTSKKKANYSKLRIRSVITHSLLLLNNRLSESEFGRKIVFSIPKPILYIYVAVIKLINNSLRPA